MHQHVCNKHQATYLIRKTNKCFSYTIFPVKKINVEMLNSLFNFSNYSHPQIWKFQGVTLPTDLAPPSLPTLLPASTASVTPQVFSWSI
jgi:hypothetical protein